MAGRILSNLIEIRQGDSFDMPIHLKSGGKDLDITGFIFKMQVKDNTGKVLITKIGDVADAARGRACISLMPVDTNIAPGDYLTDIQVTFPNGQVHTLFPQKIGAVAVFRITEQVTQ